jgi:hypothetical protein
VAVSGRVAALALLVAGAAVGVIVPLAACERLSAPPAVASVLNGAYALGHLVCHQRPDRSFFSCGQQWPVCGRCAGLYMGFAFGAVGALVSGRARRSRVAWLSSDPSGWWRGALLAAAAPTAALWLIEFGAGWNPGTPARWVAALPLGMAVAAWLAAIGRGDLR